MPSLTLSTKSLRERSDKLHELFIPLRGSKPRVAIRSATDSPRGMTALVAMDEKAGAVRYLSESFRSSAPALRCSYYELWRGPAGDDWALNRAYFTLLGVAPPARHYDALLCIHADPADDNDLKRGPHLHVSCAPDPLHRCHFPLEFGFLDKILRDCGSLTDAMKRAIDIVARDVLPRFAGR
jgi:hypothetical protein